MNIRPMITTDFETTGPYTGLAAIESKLLKHNFLVVENNHTYLGVLTVSDAIRNPRKLVIDCLTEKPGLEADCDLDTALRIMEKYSLHILPAFESKRFLGIICYRNIIKNIHALNRRIQHDNLQRIGQLETTQFVSRGIAHDFNNILMNILGNISLSKLRIPENHPVQTFLEAVEAAAMRCTRMTQQLMNYSLNHKPEIKSLDVEEIIRTTTDFALRGTSVRVEYSFSPDTGSISANADQIKQMLENLLINAVQAMEPEGQIRIATHAEMITRESDLPLEPGRYVIIRIADTGCGIPAQVLDNIFNPYFTTRENGNGIGLALVHAIIQTHNGHISVDSLPEKGTTFSIYLPRSHNPIIEKTPDAQNSSSPA